MPEAAQAELTADRLMEAQLRDTLPVPDMLHLHLHLHLLPRLQVQMAAGLPGAGLGRPANLAS